jgi:probable DNA repair protein
MLHPAIARALERGALLITPNQRAARALRRAYDAAQTATLWKPAEVLPLETWLANLWHGRIVAGSETRTLLNPSQQHLLWREIIAADPEAQGLRSPDALADLAARAWSLACLHDGRQRLREFPLSTDHRAFDRWSRRFEQRLTRGDLMTPAELPAALGAASNLPGTPLALVDFDTQTPAVSSLFDRLRDLGADIDVIQTVVTPATQHLYVAGDDREELVMAARWARSRLDANPKTRIAIVVPDLEGRRTAIERTFAPILSPQSLPITAPAVSAVYEFSLGKPLAELPLSLSALTLLSWPLRPLSIEQVSALLASPWFVTQNPSETATFDAYELRQARVLRPELTLASAIRLIERSPRRESLGELLFRLRGLQRAAEDSYLTPRPGQSEPLRQPYGVWADAFRAALGAAGWTQHARTSSLAFQQHRAWESALDELATLDFEGSLPRVDETLAAFNRILRQTIFAPETTDAPLQILGPLELGGVAFDALWFLGADDLAWPPMVATSPLLPWQMQRTLSMPGADRERDDARARAITLRIAHSAAEVVFSYALQSEEGERRPSPLLAGLNLAEFAPDSEPPQPGPAEFEILPDDVFLPPLPGPEVRGGTQILKLQAACAFRAFAERRLASKAPESPSQGFDARDSGSLVHQVMEHLWTEVATQASLRALAPNEVSAALNRAIDQSLRTSAETSWDEAYLAIQRQRLHDLLTPWLALEARRPPFTVQPPEQQKHFQLGPLTLDLRIDRIDSTAAGDFILDYKTGLAAPSQWQGERPDEPQLPLYALLAHTEGRPLAGVAFALLRAGDGLAMKGYAEDASLFPDSKPSAMEGHSLAEQVELWQYHLTALAEAFAAGDTRVLPKDYPKTCSRCDQRILCRLNPDALVDLPAESEEADDV